MKKKTITACRKPAQVVTRERERGRSFMCCVLVCLSLALGEHRAGAVPSLHSKVFNLDIQGVEKLLKEGSGVNGKDGDGRTPLFYCLYPSATHKTAQERVMAILIKNGADVNVPDRNGVTPIIEALTYGNVRAAVMLMEHGAFPTSRDNTGSSALHKASETAGADFVAKLVQGGCDVNWRDRSGWTPLHEAAENGNAPVVTLLIKMGADVNARNEEQNTPLHLAVLEDRGETINDLVAAGADVNAVNLDGNTPLFLAVRENGELAVNVLLNNGSTVNLFNKEGITPLHRAAYFGLDGIAGTLVSKGARVDAETPQGVTPLHLAVQWGHRETVQLLLDRGADAARKTGPQRKGETALHIVARNGMKEIARILLEKGAPSGAADENGNDPFHEAVDASNIEVAQLIGTFDKRKEPYYFVISSYPGTGDFFAGGYLYEGEKKTTYAPSRAFDRSLKTCWMGNGKEGEERIAFFTRTAFKKLRIYPGWGAGRKDYFRNNRLKRALFSLYTAERHNLQKTGKLMTVHELVYSRELLFSDEIGYHEFELPGGKTSAGYLGILAVKEVYRGPKGLTCIAEINPLP